MKRRKSKAPFAKWYKSCRKQLPKSNCDQLLAIAKRRVSKVSFAGTPDEHANMAYAHRDRANEAEGRAVAAYRRGDCAEALAWGLRAVAASKASIEHANETGNGVLVERIRQSNAAVDTFVTKQLPMCLKKKLAPL